jgi:hypothetical protein
VHGVVAGADGNIWFSTEQSLGHMTTTGTGVTRTWLSYNQPRPCEVSPFVGPAGGGQNVTIKGRGFASAARVTIGGADASSWTVISDEEIHAVTPPSGTAGPTSVSVYNAAGQGWGAASYTYEGNPVITSLCPSFGPKAGGQHLHLHGTNLRYATDVSFDGTPGTVLGWRTVSGDLGVDEFLEVVTPAHALGRVNVLVSNTAGTSLPGKNAKYTFLKGPGDPCAPALT